MEYEHLTPVAEVGSDDEGNVRLTCFDCNRRKI